MSIVERCHFNLEAFAKRSSLVFVILRRRVVDVSTSSFRINFKNRLFLFCRMRYSLLTFKFLFLLSSLRRAQYSRLRHLTMLRRFRYYFKTSFLDFRIPLTEFVSIFNDFSIHLRSRRAETALAFRLHLSLFWCRTSYRTTAFINLKRFNIVRLYTDVWYNIAASATRLC